MAREDNGSFLAFCSSFKDDELGTCMLMCVTISCQAKEEMKEGGRDTGTTSLEPI